MVLCTQWIARGLSSNALTLTIDEEFDLVGATEVAPHINIVAWHPIPVREEMKHRFLGPLTLVHIIDILGETCEVDDAEVARARREAVRRGFTDIVEARPNVLTSNVWGMLHHIPGLFMSARP